MTTSISNKQYIRRVCLTENNGFHGFLGFFSYFRDFLRILCIFRISYGFHGIGNPKNPPFPPWYKLHQFTRKDGFWYALRLANSQFHRLQVI